MEIASLNKLIFKSITEYNPLNICFLIIILLSSCSSTKKVTFVDLSKGKIEKSFEIENEKIKKFEVKVKPKRKPKIIKKIEIKKEKKLEQKNKKLKKDKTVKFLNKNKEEVLINDDIVEEEKYPVDYPKALIKYDKVSKKNWKKFKPKIYENEEFVFEVSFLGITAGHIKMTSNSLVEINGEDAYYFKAHLRSARYYKYIYELDDTLESFVGKKTFMPLKYTLVQRESGQDVDDLQLFDQDKLKTYFFYKRLKDNKLTRREKEEWIPRYYQDSYSALYFVRGFPLKKGDIYEFPIVTRGKIWILKMKVGEQEEIKIQGKWVKAIKISAETHFPGVLKKKGDILFWYSADYKKRLLKFQAKVKIGSIEGELIEYKDGK